MFISSYGRHLSAPKNTAQPIIRAASRGFSREAAQFKRCPAIDQSEAHSGPTRLVGRKTVLADDRPARSRCQAVTSAAMAPDRENPSIGCQRILLLKNYVADCKSNYRHDDGLFITNR